jgi:hypothetical protein
MYADQAVGICQLPLRYPDNLDPKLFRCLSDFVSGVNRERIHDEADRFAGNSGIKPVQVLFHKRDRTPTAWRMPYFVLELIMLT